MKKRLLLAALTLPLLHIALGDEVHTSDGSVLQGKITLLDGDKLVIETKPFGKIEIPRSAVTGVIMEDASVRLSDDSVLVGTITNPEANVIQVKSDRAEASAKLEDVQQIWPKAQEDPRVVAERRNWKIDLTASADGKSGNTSEQNYSGIADAVLSGPNDELKLYGRYSRSTSEGTKTADETIGGIQYSSYFYDPLGWYVRTELEQDEFENIDLRSTTAGGLSYRMADEKHYKLSGRTGLSYRHEVYSDGSPDDGVVGLDFGLSHFYRFKNRWEVKNELTYEPAIEDFSNYLATQDSWLALPVGSSEWWKIKLGLRNDYNNQPGADRERLDSTWYGAISISKE